MINAIVGRPRAGKSYESVMYHILPSAKEGRKVVTNIPVNLERVARFYGQETADNITIVVTAFNEYGAVRPFSVPDDFTKFDWKNDKGQGVLFVIDEAHLSLGRDAKTPVLEYLSLHGHYGHDIIIVTQSPRKLHRDLKDMVEVCWRCVKKSAFGDDTHYIKKTYHGVPSRNEDFIHEEEREYEKQYFGFYKSHTQSATSVTEATAKDIAASMFPHKKIIIFVMVIGFAFAVFAGKKMISGSQAAESQNKDESKVGLAVNQPPLLASTLDAPSQLQSKPMVGETYDSQVRRTDTKRKPDKSFHPFYKVTLHIDSVAEFTLNRYLVKEVYFVAAQNGQALFTISTKDLRLAGYDVSVYGDCAVLVKYDNYEDWITCDRPQVEVMANNPVESPEA